MLDQIKELREKTDVSVMACKKALEEAGGDMEKAARILRKEGAKVADKKSSRELKAGAVSAYVHATGRLGALVELRCETDFVGKNEAFIALARDIAMHVAASDPLCVAAKDVPEGHKEEIRKIFEEEVGKIDKPADIKEKILEGKMSAYLKERILLEQPFVKNQDITVGELISDSIQKFGENMEISRFARFQV